MIKKFFLTRQILRLTHHGEEPRQPVPFEKAKHVGVLASLEEVQEGVALRQFIDRLQREGKTVEVLLFSDKKQTPLIDFPHLWFRRADVSWRGAFKHAKVNHFIHTRFDYLFALNRTPVPSLTHVMAKSRAHCRVGPYHKLSARFFELMYRRSSDAEPLSVTADRMLQYAQMLRP